MSQEFNTAPNAVLETVQSMRLEILLSQKEPGKEIDIDKDQLKLMKDLADTAKGQLMVQSSDNNADSMREVAAAMAALSMKQESGNPFAVGNGRPNDMPQLDAIELEEYEILDDEVVQGLEAVEYDEVMTSK